MSAQLVYVAEGLHFAGAIAVALVASSVFLISSGRTHPQKGNHERDSGLPRRHHVIAFSLILSTYLAEFAALVAKANNTVPRLREAQIFHSVLVFTIWALVWNRDAKNHPPTRALILATAVVNLVFDIPLLVLAALGNVQDSVSIVRLVSQAIRTIPLVFLAAYHIAKRREQDESESEESESLIRTNGSVHAQNTSYGAISDSHNEDADDDHNGSESGQGDDDDSEDEDDDASIKRQRAKRLKEKGGWWGYLSDFSIFLPFLIPKKDRKVQLCILVCLLCILATRAFNVLLPRQLGIVADQLLARQNPLGALVVWFILSVLSQGVLLDLVLELAKIPIKQFSYRQLTNAAFNHVLSLPMEFHAERDSAEVMKAIEQGEALTNVLDQLVLDLLPTVADLVIALAYLYSMFNSYVALAMAVAAVTFVAVEVNATSWNLDTRRVSSKAKREEARVMHQAVQGWQTVTYFNMFSFERLRFGNAVDDQLRASRDWAVRDACIQSLLDLMVPCTFFVLASLVIHDIATGRSSPGGFVFLIQYWEYLIWPLKYLSHNYRYLMSDLVDAERLMYLLQTRPSISDSVGAVDVDAAAMTGHVEFKNVCFSYEPGKKQIIHDFNLSVSPGQTVALVGETGAGKSTIMKLLLRFYDVTSGSITLGGHDIRSSLTLSSLRSAVGVVPQDPLLFNATILENLRYARPEATDAEIHDACRAAAIHDKISSFAQGYETKVGEQGVKLSGGEVQRIAIARVFLKDPPVLVLDEATSAVDTNTESSIREALDALLSKDGGGGDGGGGKKVRTTFIIAHRLSTVVGADRILVMHQGRVVESGTHAELLKKEGGRYKGLWEKQVASL